MQTVWGDDARFVKTYWTSVPNRQVYSTFDWGIRDEDGYYFILGRTDDVINVAGHRLGTREIEESISSHPNVAEVAVVGVADTLKGQVAMAFAVLKDPSKAETPELALKQISERTHTKPIISGEVLYSLDPRPFEIAVAGAEARVGAGVEVGTVRVYDPASRGPSPAAPWSSRSSGPPGSSTRWWRSGRSRVRWTTCSTRSASERAGRNESSSPPSRSGWPRT